MRVGFLGLGTMGAPMAGHVLAAGHDLIVYNRTPARADALVARGARRADTPRAAAAERQVVITMLGDERSLEAVLSGPDGLLAGLEPGTVVVEMSTVGRAAALDAARRIAERGARFVDAPVSGTRGPAIAGKLLVIAGGAAPDVELASSVLRAFGTVQHVGPVGSGAAMKLVLNGLGAQMLTALCSVLGLAERLGLDRGTVLDVVQAGAFSSPTFAGKRARLLSPDPGADADFKMGLWEKDQRLVLEEAARQGYAMPQLDAVRALIQQAIDRGLGDEDMAAIIRVFEPSSRA
jgi:3-hydroxyisobutyrate dehydrogenase-like beta-hydroxyacid dehydrogenase